MSEHKAQPGDLASITLSNGHVHPVAWWRLGSGWITPTVTVHPVHVVAARPLVLIDPEDREQVERLNRLYWDTVDAETAQADMQAALREFANPPPPRPEQPAGLGAVVEDVDGRQWVRLGTYGDAADNWRRAGIAGGKDGKWTRWNDIAAVRVLSEGVTNE